jgi:hypothetical protein
LDLQWCGNAKDEIEGARLSIARSDFQADNHATISLGFCDVAVNELGALMVSQLSVQEGIWAVSGLSLYNPDFDFDNNGKINSLIKRFTAKARRHEESQRFFLRGFVDKWNPGTASSSVDRSSAVEPLTFAPPALTLGGYGSVPTKQTPARRTGDGDAADCRSGLCLGQ